jgi:flagellum-specific ATP synthase
MRFASPNPLKRKPIHEPLDTGVRAINAMLSVGRGQRMGLFAGSGVGKSVLLSMLTRNCVADVIVIALVGERSREVREFCDDQLDDVSRSRAVVVASPADTSPLARAKGAEYATDVATWFRDQGKHVVLIVDSLTRYAMAQPVSMVPNAGGNSSGSCAPTITCTTRGSGPSRTTAIKSCCRCARATPGR